MMSDPDLYITGLLHVFISFFVLFLVEKIVDRLFLLISKVISTKIFPVLLLNIKYVFAKNFFSWDIYHIDQPNCLDV